jgi:hypothetical protein
MAQKAARPSAFLLDKDRFDSLLTTFKYAGIGAFCERTGISRRTLADIRSHRGEPSLTNVRLILDGFDGVAFETLFVRNPDAAKTVDEYADLAA